MPLLMHGIVYTTEYLPHVELKSKAGQQEDVSIAFSSEYTNQERIHERLNSICCFLVRTHSRTSERHSGAWMCLVLRFRYGVQYVYVTATITSPKIVTTYARALFSALMRHICKMATLKTFKNLHKNFQLSQKILRDEDLM